MALNWLERAVAPRNVANDRGALTEALKKADIGPINVAYVDKTEPRDFAQQMVTIFSAAGTMGKLIPLPADAKIGGASMHSSNAKGTLAGKIMWDVAQRSFTRIGSGSGGLLGPEILPKGENTLVIGNNDPAFFGVDGQNGEGIDTNGRPLPSP